MSDKLTQAWVDFACTGQMIQNKVIEGCNFESRMNIKLNEDSHKVSITLPLIDHCMYSAI